MITCAYIVDRVKTFDEILSSKRLKRKRVKTENWQIYWFSKETFLKCLPKLIRLKMIKFCISLRSLCNKWLTIWKLSRKKWRVFRMTKEWCLRFYWKYLASEKSTTWVVFGQFYIFWVKMKLHVRPMLKNTFWSHIITIGEKAADTCMLYM